MGKWKTDSRTPNTKIIVRGSNFVFNESTMNQSVEKPIEVRRVIFSGVPTLHKGPVHNTWSASQVVQPSNTDSENFNSAQPNDSP